MVNMHDDRSSDDELPYENNWRETGLNGSVLWADIRIVYFIGLAVVFTRMETILLLVLMYVIFLYLWYKGLNVSGLVRLIKRKIRGQKIGHTPWWKVRKLQRWREE